jgi:UDPglucose--hexose-1-phosphate uridylyltransferase
MDIRRDPVTQSWVVTGYRENLAEPGGVCPLCSGLADQQPATLSWPEQGPWQVRVIPHTDPIYRAESGLERKAEGIYDKMARAGAHEILVETPQHDRPMAQFSDEEIERILWAAAQRIAELKKDPRFKYVTVFKNQGLLAGEEWSHAHSQLVATTFVPRRVKYELRSARQWFQEKDRCVFCDIVRQEEKSGQRIVDVQGEYYALCPYASRVPYEIWVLHRRHNHAFEHPRPGSNRRNLAALLGRTLRRLQKFAPAFHMVIHTAPNTLNRKGEMAGYWKTLADDYHWHIEILPIVQPRGLSYGIKEVYVNAVLPEQAAEYLRGLDASS